MGLFKKLIGSVLILITFLAFGLRDDDPLEKLITALQKWTEMTPQEKVYLQMDKPYYSLGDTVWFKGYATTGSRHQLSAISGALYVDLITEQDSIVESLKLPISAGLTKGNFVLVNDLNEGNYRIRAYTNWMRNAGEDYFFDHTFIVSSPFIDDVIARSDYRYQTINDKSLLTATLQYADNEGKPLSEKRVDYNVIINKKTVYSKSSITDDQGRVILTVPNDKHTDLRGAYISTKILLVTANDKSKVSKDFPIKIRQTENDIQFFPEGGNLINGISSKVAFKAIGVDGIGISVKGKIVDNNNKEVANLESLKFGMGSFTMIPESGKNYFAKVLFADSTEKSVQIPKASEEGYILNVFQPNKDSILVRVKISPALVSKSSDLDNLYIVVHSGGEMISSSIISVKRTMSSLWLKKSAFPSGIAQFTLFNSTMEPLSERISFIRNDDNMTVKLSTLKKVFHSKERIQLEIEARDRNDSLTIGDFSVTVIDQSTVPFEEEKESTIFSNLLLTSDLKGYVERPNYYFLKDDEEVNKALDNLMMTQGYRRFSWKAIFTDSIQPSKDPKNAYLTHARFKPEGLGTDITGIVKTLGGSLIPGAKVTLMSIKAGILESATSDANGRFKFAGLVLTDSIKFTLMAKGAKNSNKVEIILDTVQKVFLSKNRNIADINTDIPGTIHKYFNTKEDQNGVSPEIYQPRKGQRLKGVQIIGKKVNQNYATPQGSVSIPEGHADKSVDMTSRRIVGDLGATLRALIPNVKFQRWTPDPLSPQFIENYPFAYNPINKKFEPMKIILDGREMRELEAGGVFDDTTIDAEDVAKVEVVLTNAALITSLGGPTILIYSKKDKRKNNYNPNMLTISPKGFNRVKEFYSPRYDNITLNNELPDARSTIYWNASVKTYRDKKTIINYFNGDGPGKYKVIVEGINSQGEIGRQTYQYVVEAN